MTRSVGKMWGVFIYKTGCLFWNMFCFSFCLMYWCVQSFLELFIFMWKWQIAHKLSFSKREHKDIFLGKSCTLAPLLSDFVEPVFRRQFLRLCLHKESGTLGLFSLMSWDDDLLIDNDFRPSSVWTGLISTVWSYLPEDRGCVFPICEVLCSFPEFSK